MSSVRTGESNYVSDMNKMSYWWIALYGSKKDSLLWASMLFPFQWKQEKFFFFFFLGPGLISTSPCFKRSKKAKTEKSII